MGSLSGHTLLCYESGRLLINLYINFISRATILNEISTDVKIYHFLVLQFLSNIKKLKKKKKIT